MATKIQLFDKEDLIGNMPLAAGDVLFGFCQMLEVQMTIHAPLPNRVGGSAIGLSATGARGNGR